MMNIDYVLVTPARNEERFIEKTIRSVIVQTVLPKKWIIVSDGFHNIVARRRRWRTKLWLKSEGV
jgi:hypothetical protein